MFDQRQFLGQVRLARGPFMGQGYTAPPGEPPVVMDDFFGGFPPVPYINPHELCPLAPEPEEFVDPYESGLAGRGRSLGQAMTPPVSAEDFRNMNQAQRGRMLDRMNDEQKCVLYLQMAALTGSSFDQGAARFWCGIADLDPARVARRFNIPPLPPSPPPTPTACPPLKPEPTGTATASLRGRARPVARFMGQRGVNVLGQMEEITVYSPRPPRLPERPFTFPLSFMIPSEVPPPPTPPPPPEPPPPLPPMGPPVASVDPSAWRRRYCPLRPEPVALEGRRYRVANLSGQSEDIAWFEANRINIAQQYAGQWVIVKDMAVRGAYPDFQSAYNAGTGMFGTEPFLVKQAKEQETPINPTLTGYVR